MEDPTVAFFAISLTALVYTVFYMHITKILGTKKRVREIQEEMRRISAKLRKIDYSTEAGRKEAEEEQKKIAALTSESMMLQFKSLFVVIPIFLLVSYTVRTLFPNFVIRLPFSLPIFMQNFENFPNWRNEFGSFGWLVLCSFFSGLLMQAIIERTGKRGKDAAKV